MAVVGSPEAVAAVEVEGGANDRSSEDPPPIRESLLWVAAIPRGDVGPPAFPSARDCAGGEAACATRSES